LLEFFNGFSVQRGQGTNLKREEEHPIHDSLRHIIFVQWMTWRQIWKITMKILH